jgi:hypothetical protein
MVETQITNHSEHYFSSLLFSYHSFQSYTTSCLDFSFFNRCYRFIWQTIVLHRYHLDSLKSFLVLTGVWTQGYTLSIQALYHSNHTPALFCFIFQ